MAGITDAGFAVKTIDQILAEIEAAELAGISAILDVQPTSLIGILNGITGAALAELWELGLALYSGMDPDAASGDQLASLARVTGTVKRDATKTVVVGVELTTASGFAGAAAGDLVAALDGDATALFRNLDAVAAGAGTPTSDFEALTAGPQHCPANQLTVIAQPVTGWTAVTNPADGILGDPIETDPKLRSRRALELALPGSTTGEAIAADVLEKLGGTKSCRVLINDSDLVDGNGLPPHSLEVIAYKPGATTDDDIALATLILKDKAAGAGTHGTSSQVITDSQGNEEEIFFSRPTPSNIYVALTVVVDASTFPGDGADQIKQALVDYATAEIGPGSTIYAQALKAAVFPSPRDPEVGVKGVLDVTVFKVDTASTPTNTGNLTFTPRQLAVLATSRITVTVA